VWLESVPDNYVAGLDVAADMNGIGESHRNLNARKLLLTPRRSHRYGPQPHEAGYSGPSLR
jgi:hypothetical protein